MGQCLGWWLRLIIIITMPELARPACDFSHQLLTSVCFWQPVWSCGLVPLPESRQRFETTEGHLCVKTVCFRILSRLLSPPHEMKQQKGSHCCSLYCRDRSSGERQCWVATGFRPGSVAHDVPLAMTVDIVSRSRSRSHPLDPFPCC